MMKLHWLERQRKTSVRRLVALSVICSLVCELKAGFSIKPQQLKRTFQAESRQVTGCQDPSS